MRDTNTCPVCTTLMPIGNEACPKCGWQMRVFFSLTDEEKALYQKELTAAQAQWQAQQPQYQEAKPNLKRDPFEYLSEYKAQLEAKSFLAGYAQLLKEQYDIEQQRFPLRLTWEQWFMPLNMSTSGYLQIAVDQAKALWIANESHPVLVKLTVKNENPTVSALILVNMDDTFLVYGISKKRRKKR